MDVAGRGVFLTGGAQGIGKAATAALLAKGAKVLFCDMNAELGKATEAEFGQKYGDKVAFAQCDVTNADQLTKTFELAVSKWGRVEICLNNAGIMDETVWEKMLAINTTAQIRGSEIAYEHMRRDNGGKGGVIVNTVSVAGFMPNFMLPVYIASKHAMLGYTLSRAGDPDNMAAGVRWCALCPMPANTGMLQLKEGQVKKAQLFMDLMKPLTVQPEDVVAGLMTMLADPESNGKSLVVSKAQGAAYKRRLMVEDDGETHPQLMDKPLTQHPPIPGDQA